MTRSFHTLRGLILLSIMVLRTRGRSRSTYWTWRNHTAFGDHCAKTGPSRLQAVLEYCRWLSRTRTISQEATSMPGNDPNFSKAFLPGLIIGLIVGAIAGAVLPDLISGPRVPAHAANHETTDPANHRDRRDDPGLVDPTLIPEQSPDVGDTLPETPEEVPTQPDDGSSGG